MNTQKLSALTIIISLAFGGLSGQQQGSDIEIQADIVVEAHPLEDLVESFKLDSISDTIVEIDESATFDISLDDVHRASITEVDGTNDLSSNGFIYGERDYPVTFEALALASYGVAPDSEDAETIFISPAMEVKDTNGETVYFAFNITSEINDPAYVLVGAHTRIPLLPEPIIGSFLNPDCEFMYLIIAGLTCEIDKIVTVVDTHDTLTVTELADLIVQDKAILSSTDRVELNELELENQTMLNFLAAMSGEERNDAIGKQYAGQSGSGYGQISTPATYLKSRYGGTWTLSTFSQLPMPNFTMQTIDDLAPSSGHCIPTAVTRGFAHARNNKGFTKITTGNQQLFKEVRVVSVKNGFKNGNCSTCGVAPNRIEQIIERVGDDQGYPKTDSKWIGVFSWSNTVKSSIRERNPLILTFVRGTYGSHGVTVFGWAEYKSDKGKTARLLKVYDGWTSSVRYVDFDAFTTVGSRDFSLASFYPIIVKK